jgi:hypothetical protein
VASITALELELLLEEWGEVLGMDVEEALRDTEAAARHAAKDS